MRHVPNLFLFASTASTTGPILSKNRRVITIRSSVRLEDFWNDSQNKLSFHAADRMGRSC